MPVILEFEDATGDPYSVEAAETDRDGPCVHILYFGGGAAPRDILLFYAPLQGSRRAQPP